MFGRFGIGLALATGLGLAAAAGYIAEANKMPLKRDVSVLQSVSADAVAHPQWLRGDRTELPREMPERWSPFHWSRNASLIAGSATSMSESEIDHWTGVLLEILDENSTEIGGRKLVIYNFDYRAHHLQMQAPWYSALGNAYIAIGLMHLSEATGRADLLNKAGDFISTIDSPFLSYRHDGDLWFSEYANDIEEPHDHGVINGHFSAIAALQEWQFRTGETKYTNSIRAGLYTMSRWLPRVMKDEYFAYARDTMHFPDYGQQRAVNQAAAACEMTGHKQLCKTAREYAIIHESREHTKTTD